MRRCVQTFGLYCTYKQTVSDTNTHKHTHTQRLTALSISPVALLCYARMSVAELNPPLSCFLSGLPPAFPTLVLEPPSSAVPPPPKDTRPRWVWSTKPRPAKYLQVQPSLSEIKVTVEVHFCYSRVKCTKCTPKDGNVLIGYTRVCFPSKKIC